jgi:hypothetical protein
MNPIRVLVVDSVVPGFSGMHTLDMEDRTISWDPAVPGSERTVKVTVTKADDGTIVVHDAVTQVPDPPPFPEILVPETEPKVHKKSWRQQQRELPKFLR